MSALPASGRFPSFLLLRSYVVIAAGILLAGLVLDSLLVRTLPDSQIDNARRYAPVFALLESVILTDTSGTEIATRFQAMQPELQAAVNMPVSLLQADDFAGPGSGLSSLPADQPAPFYDDQGRELLYKHIAGSDLILALGPVPVEPGASGYLEGLIITAYYLLVAAILFLWIRPFYRDLATLQNAASRFGHNDFSSRVDVDARSSIMPVARAFNRMAERIQYLVTAHRELTHAVSHELRTPLARFKFSLEILSRSQDPKKNSEYLASMKSDVQELETLVDELLSYARFSEENLHLARSSVDLKTWLVRQVDQYSDESINVRLAVPTTDPLTATFNPDLMARAMHNIVRNCLRYANTTITVTAQQVDADAVIRICDDGPGIPEDKRETVFEPFSRLDTSRDRQSGGYGLGLAIARRILQRHGGDIQVETNLPTGACFVLRWPLADLVNPL